MKVKLLKKYKIVVKKATSECNKYAAEKLNEYVKKTCGFSLKILTDDNNVCAPFFSIGETAFFEKNKGDFDRNETIHDGFRIFKTEDESVYFDSLTDRGVMYAVFDFIENELGVKFLTAKIEVTPALKEVDFSHIDRVVKPEFEMAAYSAGDVFDNTYSRADENHYARTRTKDVYTKISEKIGGPLKIYGRNVSHNFHFYVPFPTYGIKHYDWYHFFDCNNEVVPVPDITNGITEDGKLDETMDKSVAKIVIEEMKKDIDKYPDVEIFMLTQEDTSYFNDDNNRRLEKKYKRSGILMRFINVVARAMDEYCKEKYPGRKVRLMTFAYSYTVQAPVKTEDGKIVPIDETVVAADNVIIQLAFMSNAYYNYFDEKQESYVKKSIDEWSVIAKAFWFWAYDINFHRFHYFFDSFFTVEENLRGWKKMGITYLFVEAGERHGVWQMDLKGYVYRQLFKDVNRSQEYYINEFCQYVYGPAAQNVLDYIYLNHNHYKALADKGEKVCFIMRNTCEDPANTPLSLIEKGMEIIKAGEKAIENSNCSKVKKCEYLRELAKVMLSPLVMLNDHYYDYFPGGNGETRKPYHDMLVSYYEKCEDNRMEVGSLTPMTEFFDELIQNDKDKFTFRDMMDQFDNRNI